MRGNIIVAIMLASSVSACGDTQKITSDSAADTSTDAQTTEPYTNSLGMTFAAIPSGTFIMGSSTDEPGRNDDESQHEVTLTQPFHMQTTETTQAQWVAVMGSNPSGFDMCGDDCPVETISFDDILSFVAKLNALGEGTYRLPTEAEWEYAARAGSTAAFASGDITEEECEEDPILDQLGWYCFNSEDKTHPVAQKDPNAWGLYDMHGNVWEWTQDRNGDYPSGPATDPTGPDPDDPVTDLHHVARGGGSTHPAKRCRSAHRGGRAPLGSGDRATGFRIAVNP